MVTFPQGGGRARVYLCPSTEDPQRFAGPRGAERFLQAAALDAVPKGQAWTEAIPVGPCRTFPADDTWTDRPFVEGVVLIGDAAGYSNPLIGQGLAIALRDVRSLSDQLLARPRWDEQTFVEYGVQRAERMRRVRFLAQLHATVWVAFGPRGRALRRRVAERSQDDPSLLAAVRGVFTGPDQLDPQVCTDHFRIRYLGLGADRTPRHGDEAASPSPQLSR
jgi:menaquinone-9 beta-reductase